MSAEDDAAPSTNGSQHEHEEVTKVTPISARVLNALRDIRRNEIGQRELEQLSEPTTEHDEVLPSPASGIRVRTLSHAPLPAPARQGDADVDDPQRLRAARQPDVRDFLPTAEMLDVWFEDLCEPVVSVDVTVDADGSSALAPLPSQERSVTVVMAFHPVPPPTVDSIESMPPSKLRSLKAHRARLLVLLVVSIVVLALVGYTFSQRWSKSTVATRFVR